jgi:hypothetical protein
LHITQGDGRELEECLSLKAEGRRFDLAPDHRFDRVKESDDVTMGVTPLPTWT